MYDRETELTVPESFNFPFSPYEIQKQLMEEHFRTIEEKKIGIFESPTGTGKTLTLVCSALTWIVQHEKVLNEELLNKIEKLKQEISELEKESNKQSDWISAQYETLQLKQKLSELKTELDNLTKYYKEIDDLKHRTEVDLVDKIEKFTKRDVIDEDQNEEDNFLIESDDEPEEEPIENKFNDVKIFFCSRTHSQLSQVVSEVKRTIFKKETRVISLASRQNYCINNAVKALKSNTLINEKCLELQKNKGKSIKKGETKRQKTSEPNRCQFYNQVNIERLRNESVGKIMDIEELGNLGKSRQACPYYSSRLTSVYSQLVLVPYQMILHKKTREQLGIDIRNSILVIDEAHNLLDTISNIYCAEITLTDLQTVKEHLEQYRKKYISRFSPNTVLRLRQLIFVAKSFALTLKNQEDNKMLTVPDFFYEAELFEIKLSELVKFAETSRLAQKVHGLAVSEERKNQIPEKAKPGIKDFLMALEGKKEEVAEVEKENPKVHFPNVIRPFLAFLDAILNDSDDGRVLLSNKARMKYLILNPGAHFQEVINKCRSVTLAGGTMQPVDEVIEQLFHKQKDRVHVSCFGHVVPKESVVALSISKGPSGKELLFNYANRGDQVLMRDLASSISNICNVVPAGIVCFFPSYDFIDSFFKYINENGFLDKMKQKKVVYVENRRTQVDTVLEKYSKSIKYLKNNSNESQNGAILLSVVGGKLSEGLNFSDDLGRCVVVIGLPFPNKNDPELNERIKYLNEHLHATAGREYYENLCMKAVNQCIGRAVRHINDYASVVLLDTRFSMAHIREKLPAWIERSLQVAESFGRAQQQLVSFFKAKQIQHS